MNPSEYFLIEHDDVLLKNTIEPFEFGGEVDAKEIAKLMQEKLEEYNGLGLSANQIGLKHRVFVMRTEPITFCFNPVVTAYGQEMSVMEEGCLTYPGLFVKIRRPSNIRVRFKDVNGESHTEKFAGMTSRIFQHELDHLNGINYLDRASKYHMDKAKRKMKMFNRKVKRTSNEN